MKKNFYVYKVDPTRKEITFVERFVNDTKELNKLSCCNGYNMGNYFYFSSKDNADKYINALQIIYHDNHAKHVPSNYSYVITLNDKKAVLSLVEKRYYDICHGEQHPFIPMKVTLSNIFHEGFTAKRLVFNCMTCAYHYLEMLYKMGYNTVSMIDDGKNPFKDYEHKENLGPIKCKYCDKEFAPSTIQQKFCCQSHGEKYRKAQSK